MVYAKKIKIRINKKKINIRYQVKISEICYFEQLWTAGHVLIFSIIFEIIKLNMTYICN